MSNNDDFDFWGSAEESTGEFESKGGDLEVIPSGTRCLAVIDDISWKEFPSDEGEAIKYIAARWAIMKPSDYQNRKVFHNIKIFGDDPNGKFFDASKQAEKTKREAQIFWAIDKNAGGHIAAKGKHEITDQELQKRLINKPMFITLAVWESSDKEKKGNWIRKIEPSNTATAQETKPVKQATAAKTPINDDYDDIPF